MIDVPARSDAIAPKTPRELPRVGLGLAPLGDLFDVMPERQAADLLEAAWEAGYRLYDTAPWYGHGISEHRLGTLLRQVPRADVFVSTKVGRVYEPAPRGEDVRIQWAGGLNFSRRFDYTAEGFAASLAQSRLRLGQSSVDALVIHDLDRIYHGDAFEGHLDALMASGLDYLKMLKASGEIALIGMGMNTLDDFTFFAPRMEVDFFIVAMPYTLMDQASLHGPMAECVARGIGVVIGSPYASGILADPEAPGVRYNYEPASDALRAKALAIRDVCRRFDVPLQAAALQFPLRHPAVRAIIPGALTADQARQNMVFARTDLPDALWEALKAEGLIDPASPT